MDSIRTLLANDDEEEDEDQDRDENGDAAGIDESAVMDAIEEAVQRRMKIDIRWFRCDRSHGLYTAKRDRDRVGTGAERSEFLDENQGHRVGV